MYAGQVVESRHRGRHLPRAGASLYAGPAGLHPGARPHAARRSPRHHPRHGPIAGRRDARLPLRRPLPARHRRLPAGRRSRSRSAPARSTWCAASATRRSRAAPVGAQPRRRHEPRRRALAAQTADQPALLEARDVSRSFPGLRRHVARQAHAARGRGRQPRRPAGRGGGAGRRIRLRQDHAGAHAARAAAAVRRARSASTAGRSRALARREIASLVQPVFQDPYSSLNPRKSIGSIIALPLRVQGDLRARKPGAPASRT